MGNRITRTVLFAASALFSVSAFGAGAARFGTLRNSDWVVTNAWQAVSNKTHDLILEIGHEGSLPPDWLNVSNAAMNAVQSLQPAYDYTDNALISFSSTGSVFRSFSYGTPNRWTDATGCVWEVAYRYEDDWVADSSRITHVDYTSAGYDDDPDLWAIYFIVDGSFQAEVYSYQPGPTQTNLFISASDWETQYVGAFDFNIYRSPHEVTNLVGRVALTNDIFQAISTNNSAFVSAVLAAPLVGADPDDLSEIAEYGSYGTVGAALLALIAGLAALKRRMAFAETSISVKASLTDLPYAIVTPGEWNGESIYGKPEWYPPYGWVLEPTGSFYQPVIDGLNPDAMRLEFDIGESELSVFTRASLPGHILDRANNLIDATTGNVTLTLPPFVAGKVRDLLVACTIGLDGNDEPWSVIFQGGDGEGIAFKAVGDDAAAATFPVPDAAGDWWYSLTERAPHVFAVSLKQLQSVSQPTQGGS